MRRKNFSKMHHAVKVPRKAPCPRMHDDDLYVETGGKLVSADRELI